VEAGTRFFWLLIALLVGAAGFFGLNAESRRRAVQSSQTTLESGAIVQLQRVVDGDTLLVDAAGQTVVVRLLGIKAFPVQPERDPLSRFGKAAVDELRRMTENQPLRVLLHNPPRDRHGRTLAELFAGQSDVGLELVKRGHALVYTVHPFPSMPLYQQEQEEARADRRGLWANEHAVRQADLMIAQWGRETE
jgi:micrococcal nuclease